ncbi:hypothetical protein RUM43_001031 [Polyplax serrata]|uniref:Uncharacterized protein n=1 Tax=Polyplax serrata TaxID=468196 RepID=A0AAN8SD71_POLSC
MLRDSFVLFGVYDVPEMRYYEFTTAVTSHRGRTPTAQECPKWVPPDLPQQIKYLAGVLLENPSARPKIP